MPRRSKNLQLSLFEDEHLQGEIHPTRAREETPESRGIPCLFLNTERGFGGKPPKKSGFVGILAGSKMPKETSFTAISRWRTRPMRPGDPLGDHRQRAIVLALIVEPVIVNEHGVGVPAPLTH